MKQTKNSMKLTKTSVDGLKTTGERYSRFDTEVKGFAVRISTTGDKVFYYVYRAGKGRQGTLKWLRLGSFPTITVDQARRMAKEKAAAVALGADPALEVQESKVAPYMRDAVEVFYAEHVEAKLKPSTGKQYRSLIDKRITPTLGKLKVGDVEHRHIAKLHHSMRDIPYLANRTFAVLSKFFAWVEKNGYRPRGSNPAYGIEKYKEHKRTEFMGAEELGRIGNAVAALEQAWYDKEAMRKRRERVPPDMPAISPQAANVIRLLCLTGARVGEILSLKWEYLDLDMGLARLPDSKTGFKVLHLPTPAIEILEGITEYTDWVFPGSGVPHLTDIHHAWAAVCRKAELTGWRIHDLRHAFASIAVNSGHSLPQIGALLGHNQTTTTARYAHVAENPVHAVAEDAGAKIAQAMAAPPKKMATVTRLRRTSN